MRTLVIRFSSLGDVVLSGAVTGSLGEVTFLTGPRWVDVAARLPGVQRAVAWGDHADLGRFDRVVDLHSSPRSRWFSLWGHGPVSRVARHDLRRRARVWLKAGSPPPTVIARYAQAAGVSARPTPWIQVDGPGDALVLCPGAAHATKRWPAPRWVALGQRWTGPVLVLGSHDEKPLIHRITDAIGVRAQAIAERGFSRTLAALGAGRLAVAGDTGLLHLCAAAGLPVVGLFGPTTSRDGFWSHPGQAVELDLPCRPCSRFGSERCPIGDHLCLAGLNVDRVWAAVRQVDGDPSGDHDHGDDP